MNGLWHVVRGSDVAPQPWANGAGLTRQLWIEQGDGADFTWRLSIADLVADAPFSRFPGVDRVLLPLKGVGLILLVDGHPLPLTPGSPVRFAGESEVAVRALARGLALNLMSRRGMRLDMRVRRITAGHLWRGEMRALVVLEGRVVLDQVTVLEPLDVAVLDSALVAAEGTDAMVAAEGTDAMVAEALVVEHE